MVMSIYSRPTNIRKDSCLRIPSELLLFVSEDDKKLPLSVSVHMLDDGTFLIKPNRKLTIIPPPESHKQDWEKYLQRKGKNKNKTLKI